MLLENNPYPQDGRVRREAITLVDSGFEVVVIAPAMKGQPRRERIEGVTVLRYRAREGSDGVLGFAVEYAYSLAMSVWLSMKLFVSGGFGVIHAHNPPDLFVLVALLFKPFGVRFVFDHHDLTPEMYLARFPEGHNRIVEALLRVFERLTFRFADRVIATNESYAEIAMGRGRVSKDRVAIVRNGPDPARVRVVPVDEELRSRSSCLIAYIGEMAPHDGVDHLIRALHHLATDLARPDFYCVLIGGGSEVRRLQSLANDLGLGSQVWFSGHISDADHVMRLLSSADICVTPDPLNPYTDRSTMVKTTEYMALGKPIVAFDLKENRRSAQDAALYADPNSDIDFATKIAELMDDPVRRERMGAIGRERVRSELGWPHQARHLADVYLGLLGEPAGSTSDGGRA
jgi:glycosyltransferase involved in cell wall biosynthesis